MTEQTFELNEVKFEMKSHTEHYPLNTELTLKIGKASNKQRKTIALTLPVINLALTKLDSEVIECHLTLLVKPEIYQTIDSRALFNLHPQVRNSLSNGKFIPKLDIQIEISLQPNLFPPPLETAKDAAEAANYILSLSQEDPDNSLLFTESWLALSVKQIQPDGETGYRTIWANITPANFAQSPDFAPGEEINDSLLNSAPLPPDIFKSPTHNIAQTVERMTHAFEQLADTISQISQKGISEPVEEVTNLVEDDNQSVSGETEDLNPEQKIFAAMVNFFETDDWTFTKVEGDLALQIPFEGENGQWNCYAKAIEKTSQCIFYSIMPRLVPPARQFAIAEFINRANYGTILGNFELDVTDGELRYKTSIDMGGENLSFPILQKLVYTNVTMMDRYLPGIKSVISGKLPPQEAIRLIEESEIFPPSDDLVDPQPSSPTNLTESDIFSRLTREDISKFEKIIELQKNRQRDMADSSLNKLKIDVITRLGEEGEEIFSRAYTIFQAYQLDAKQIRFIGRYTELYNLFQIEIEQLSDREDLDKTARRNLKKWQKMRAIAKKRIQRIAERYIQGQEEIDMLMETSEMREYLAVAKDHQ